ncbi:HET-domain-containing protein [Hypoxylon sp. FL1857]|nr:HET-domain-containing protein [Hypoxylon sp. FL1857]
MQYRLEAFDLSELPSTQYAALSYTWGCATSMDDIYEIVINDQPFFVRRNLFDFLDTAAGKGENGLLFVDAICINQLDSVERMFQVREMARVYRNASKVIAWLGIPESAQKVAEVRSLGQMKDIANCANWTAEQWEGFKYLSHHPYWNRVWIVQEVLLAQSMEVWCWYFTFPLSLFTSGSSISLPSYEVRYSEDGRPRSVVDAISCSRSPAERIITHRTRHVLRPIADSLAQGTMVGTLEEITAGLMRPYMVAETYQSHIPDLIHRVVRKFGMLNCTDSRDKLYGFVGLLKDSSRAKVNPDYTLPVSYAYRQALEIGLEEICNEYCTGAHVRRPDRVYDIHVAYYCDVRDAFSMEDDESMSILQEVLSEFSRRTPPMSDTIEMIWTHPFIENNRYLIMLRNFEQLLHIAVPAGDGERLRLESRRLRNKAHKRSRLSNIFPI